MNRLFIAAAFLAGFFPGVCYAQQTPRGAISGTVSNLAGQPLKNAIVRLQGQPQSYATSTDSQGNFFFENLEPAGYTLFAEHPGYLLTTYSANSKGASTQLDLSSGQQLTGIAVKMTPQGVVAGRITNQDNEPFPNVRVVLTHWVYVDGRRQLQPAGGGGFTDADGAFAIGNLAAGTYYLSAFDQSTALLWDFLRGHEGPVERYVTTYYPGVTDLPAATAIEVSAGAVIRGVDIRMRQAVLYRVRGKVVDPSSPDPPANVNLFVNPKDTFNLGGPSSTANYRNGAFEFSGVPPGVYILQAVVVGNQGPGPTGRQIVTVGNGDVEGIVVQLSRGTEIAGQILTEGSSAPSKPDAAEVNPRPVIALEPIDSSGNRGGQAKEDGTFTFSGIVRGLYRVNVRVLAAGTYVKSIHFAGQDVTKTPLDLTSGSGGKLEILLSPNAADISGVVHDPSPEANGAPAAGVTVTLWTVDFTRTVATNSNGQFLFTGLPPGEYRVAAWEQIEQGLDAVPEFRIKFEDKATAVKVNESDHARIEPVLIPRDAIEAEAAKLQ